MDHFLVQSGKKLQSEWWSRFINLDTNWGYYSEQYFNCGAVGRAGSCSGTLAGTMPASQISDPQIFPKIFFGDYSLSQKISERFFFSLFPPQAQVPAESANCKACYYGQSQGRAADQINTRTGALSYPVDDLEISTGAGPLAFRRTYISSLTDQFTSPLGHGWTHNQDIRLIFPAPTDPGFVKFKDPSGNLYRFWDTGEGTYFPYAGYTASLMKNDGPPVTYTLRDQAQNVYTFDESGKATTFVNSTGQKLTYEYENGKLDRVSYDATHYLKFHYDPEQSNPP